MAFGDFKCGKNDPLNAETRARIREEDTMPRGSGAPAPGTSADSFGPCPECGYGLEGVRGGRLQCTSCGLKTEA